jgi:uncharacterized membrane protein
VFAFILGGVLFGVFIRSVLPEGHRSDESKFVMKLGVGLIATMTALVLGLVTASAKSSFDTRDQAVKNSAIDILTLDRILARYGPETKEIRSSFRRIVAERHDAIWTSGTSPPARPGIIDPFEATAAIEGVADQIGALKPQNDAQRWLQTRAKNTIEELMKTRWMVAGTENISIPVPFLVAIVFWLAVIFAIFGMFAPRNATVLTALFLCALSVSIAVFLIMEMDTPFDGIIKVSDAPIRYVLSHLGQ